jgi:16S rRNA (adenine1518-N6/adenine1519-N6)-dimethyltransferase
MTAEPNTSDYGRLSVMTQYRCDMHNILSVPPSAFDPPPKVDSAVICMRPYDTPPVQIDNIKQFSQVVTRAFATRRKTLRNNFKGLLNDKQWLQIDIDPVRRAETLSLQEFAHLSRIVPISD